MKPLSDGLDRRLVAVMFTDMVGTALIQPDEAAAKYTSAAGMSGTAIDMMSRRGRITLETLGSLPARDRHDQAVPTAASVAILLPRPQRRFLFRRRSPAICRAS
jgi:hypothetical protein